MQYDVVVIGGGLSGLTAASLLAKRGLYVAVVDKSHQPGGSCGIFKRDGVIFDQGASMLFGFGEKGFNAHRFVFNCLQEPISVVRHDLLYCVNFKGQRIRFWQDIDRFTEELSAVFPSQKDQIKRFYGDLSLIYKHVMVDNPTYATPDETSPLTALNTLRRHPVSYLRFLSYLNKSAKTLLKKYFTDPEIFKFFDKLTSTYCYTTTEESPAILAAVMFVDNHMGGSYYPAGSTLFLPGILEKSIEEKGGDMILGQEVVRILFHGSQPSGVELRTGEKIYADHLVYSGTVWNLYGKLIDPMHLSASRKEWAEKQLPTYQSVVLYTYVDKAVIPADTSPIEMLIGNPDKLDESEVTAYISSIDDRTLCRETGHIIITIGPTFAKWDTADEAEYARMKEKEKARLLSVLEKRFPGFADAVRYMELATPQTIERYTLKNGGAVAGPKQILGQHMFKRLHTRSEWTNLFCCGESTVMGTGTPTVTVSGISAANALLKKLGLAPFVYRPGMKNYVQVLQKPFLENDRYGGCPGNVREMMKKASACQYCECPPCCKGMKIDIPGIMRRITVGNLTGAAKQLEQSVLEDLWQSLLLCEKRCIQNTKWGEPVQIGEVICLLSQEMKR